MKQLSQHLLPSVPVVLARHTSLFAFILYASANFYNLASLPECTVHKNKDSRTSMHLLPLLSKSRVSLPQHCWHWGFLNSLMWGSPGEP